MSIMMRLDTNAMHDIANLFISQHNMGARKRERGER